MRQHDRFGAIGDCGFKLSYIDVVSWNLNVDENWHEPVLNDRIDGGGKSRSDGDDLVSGRELAIAERRGSEARKSGEVGGGPGVDERSAAHAHEGGEVSFELGGKATGGEPCVKRSFDQKLELGRVKDFARHRYAALTGHKRLRSQRDFIILLH